MRRERKSHPIKCRMSDAIAPAPGARGTQGAPGARGMVPGLLQRLRLGLQGKAPALQGRRCRPAQGAPGARSLQGQQSSKGKTGRDERSSHEPPPDDRVPSGFLNPCTCPPGAAAARAGTSTPGCSAGPLALAGAQPGLGSAAAEAGGRCRTGAPFRRCRVRGVYQLLLSTCCARPGLHART